MSQLASQISRIVSQTSSLLGVCLACVLLLAPTTGLTQGQNSPPQLQIELGGHSAAVRRIDVDPARDLVVTASDDKTARVWSLSTRKLRHVLRPAIGEGTAGRLYGVALHPNQDLVALAGSVQADDSAHKILLFKTSTGDLVRSIDARAGDIKKLAWSPDGQLIIATYAGDNGLRAFDLNGQTVFEQAFPALSYGLDVSTQGVIAASTMDGFVHLFQYQNRAITFLNKIKLTGARPVGVAFSGDSKKLAVGFHGSVARRDGPQIIDVASGAVLKQMVLPRLSAGNLMTVAWTADGSRIVASGTGYDDQVRFRAFQYDAQTGDLLSNHILATDSILDMQTAGETEMVYASFSGSWGSFNPTTGKSLTTGAQLSRFRGADSLRASADGRKIGIHFEGQRSPGWFDLDKRVLTMGAIPDDLKRPRQPAGQFADTRKPLINGNAIKLDTDEFSRSAVAMQSGNDVFVGTSTSLRRHAPSGKLRWRIRTATEVRSVNLSADDQFVIAAKSDGTIDWRHADDGKLLMTALLRSDRQWVLWTPGGQFDASAGADRVVGWSVNLDSGGAANFFSLNRFRDQFSQPAHIDSVLGPPPENAVTAPPAKPGPTGRPARLTQSISAIQFPPIISAVDLSALRPGGNQLSIPFSIRATGKPQVEVRVDGRPIPDANVTLPTRFDGKARAVATILTPSPGSVIQLIARDRFGVSEPLGFSLKAQPQAPTQTVSLVPPVQDVFTADPALLAAAKTVRENALAKALAELPTAPPAKTGPKLYVLSIGISNYKDPKYQLGLAAKDSRDFLNTVRHQKGLLYSDVITRSLTDSQASRQSILDGLQWLSVSVGPDDVGMLFVAGHGVNAPDGQYYFMPFEGNHQALAQTSVPERAIRETLGRMRGKALFFVDTCFAGNALGNLQSVSRELARMANNLASAENGVVVFASSSGRQLSEENDAWGNGAFTKAVIAGLSGQADLTRSGRVTFKGLDFFISEQVSKLTEGRQTPVTISPIGVPDFAIARLTRI